MKKSMFSRRHYEVIADLLYKSDISPKANGVLTIEFANMFLLDNPKFNNEKFLRRAYRIIRDASNERRIRQ